MAAYIKFDGVDGESENVRDDDSFDFVSGNETETTLLGDGSVKFVTDSIERDESDDTFDFTTDDDGVAAWELEPVLISSYSNSGGGETEIDKASPKLMEAVFSGRHVSEPDPADGFDPGSDLG